MFLSALLLAVGTWLGWTIYSLFVHYRQAQCLGVPILVSPVGVSNIFWLIFQDAVADHIARLPFDLGYWVRYNRRSWIWSFADRGKIHQEYGPIIARVTPAEIQVWVADSEVANEIVRGKDRALFDKPREDIERVDFLGPHLMTACGETWKRHRRIVATPFTQRNNRIVWRESLHQGLVLGKTWSERPAGGVNTVWEDNETIAMNAMVSAGFGLSRDSHKSLSKENHDPSDFHSSLSFMITHFIWLVIIPSTFWFPRNLPPFPQSLRSFFQSVRAFKEHLDRMVAESKASTGASLSDSPSNELRSDNLLTALVRHSEELKRDDGADPSAGVKQRNSLTDDEIHSNLFGLAFAGHETTAHTLSYSLFLLAAHPSVQDWIAEEIHAVIGRSGCDEIEDLNLDEIFPQLKRTKAIMYETMRLFTPLANVLKRTLSSKGATIQVGTRTLRIPPRAYMLPSLYALHASEEYWGKDCLEWNPKRWISNDEKGDEQFMQPSPPGTFLPWSDGPRACPGARFSQVEFVAVCASSLYNYRISAVRRDGEDETSAHERVKSALYDSTSVVTLMIRHPEKILLRLEPL